MVFLLGDDLLVGCSGRPDSFGHLALEAASEKVRKAVLYGLLGSLALLGFYFLVMGLGSRSLAFAISELVRFKYWVSTLVLGFGMQIGLFSYLKSCQKSAGVGGAAAGSTVTSTVAMVACCAHHLTDILPIIGLSVAATFLTKYQVWFLALGVTSNVFGIALMAKRFKEMKRNA